MSSKYNEMIGMRRPYFAGRILMNLSNGFNYKQIIGNVIHNARVYQSDYIMFTTDTNSANMILNQLFKLGIELEYSSVEGETLIIIKVNDTLINKAKSSGISIF